VAILEAIEDDENLPVVFLFLDQADALRLRRDARSVAAAGARPGRVGIFS
jgi:hypothetical protein